ncbi:histone-lysine N-methyltransferase 2A [Ciona intestinalis]
MATAAKGSFPGRPRKKIEKKKVKFKREAHRKDLGDLNVTCSFITNISRQFHRIFDDENEQDIEFIGFSSEECGLRAYKRVTKKNAARSQSSRRSDILGSQSNYDQEKVTTRLSHARHSVSNEPSDKSSQETPHSTISSPLSSPDRSLNFSRDTESCNSSSSDSAFLKYKDFKLDFHRLSRKARNKDSECSAEEIAKRKDTSVKSLQYASDIYLAKDHSSVSAARSPIKPATFIPPGNTDSQLHVSSLSGTSMKIKKVPRDFDEVGGNRKGAGHPHVIAKALLARANRQNKRNNEEQALPAQPTKQKTTKKAFILPSKSARSSRIIKANRKYLVDQHTTENTPPASLSPSTSDLISSSSSCSVNISRQESDIAEPLAPTKTGITQKSPESKKRKPLIKQPTFLSDNSNLSGRSRSGSRFKEVNRKAHSQSHARKLIKRARFKHPTSSETLILGDEDPDNTSSSVIKEATFKAPNSKKRGPKSQQSENIPETIEVTEEEPELFPDHIWQKIGKPLSERYAGDNKDAWSAQEVHNILHGSHTFGNSWTTVARHYDFKDGHRDWLSVRQKALKCRSLGILNAEFKVKSSTLLQLKPKLSDNPNVTVFSPLELKVRGLTHNVSCHLGSAGRAYINKEQLVTAPPVGEACSDIRIFGTQLNGQSSNKSLNKNKISDHDIYLGVSERVFMTMLKPKKRQVKLRWEIWEIHNILHGIAYLGLGEWTKIFNLYCFHISHDNVAIRAKFKSICVRGFIVSNTVREDVLPHLRPVLTEAGREYFLNENLPIVEFVVKVGKKMAKQKFNDGMPKMKKPEKVRRASSSESDQELNISPPRKQAYHLFGAVPVWDEAAHPDIIEDAETPVLQVLENGLCNGNLSSSDAPHHSSSKKSDLPPSSSGSTEQELGAKSIKSSKSSKKKTTPDNKGRGPRIKHVSRRASLVTGHSLAKNEDATPHLSALPKVEREKIAAEVEKMKVHIPDFTSSESEEDSKVKTSLPSTVPRREKIIPGKRKTMSLRCGLCDTCSNVCGMCDGCRSSKVDGTSICSERKPCSNPTEVDPVPHLPKKAKKSLPDQTASRKSSRLQQQRAPLRSSLISDASGGQMSKHQPPPSVFISPTPNNDTKTTTVLKEVTMSPGSRFSAFENVSTLNKLATISIENWKEIYEVSRLWKKGGRALITSQPPPPRTVCLICGSFSSAKSISEGALVHCACCCEPYHPFCAEADFLNTDVLAQMKRNTWVCRKCQCCHVCGHPKNLLVCRRCKKSYHSECLGPSYPTKPSKNKVWVCMRCVRCQSCGTSKPGASGCKWTHDFTMCQRCGDLYEKGNFCPICQRCYSDEDYESRMIQCSGCKRWVHSKCESLSVEMYTLLAHMPNNVTYKCPDCDNRGTKLKQILAEQAHAAEELKESIKPEPEEIRKILSSLPPPVWRKMMENEIQTGLEAITMALFHNRATYGILKKADNIKPEADTKPLKCDDTARPRDLFAVRFAVHNGRYHSVGTFCSHVAAILDSVADDNDREEVGKAFCKEAGSVFSWFNFETGKVRDSNDFPDYLLPNATMPPTPEHDYAQWQDKDIVTYPGTPDPSPMKSQCSTTPSKSDTWASPLKNNEDLRQCIFCSKYGDDHPMYAGRLLYCSQDEWCHVNCALWSAEVYEQHDGSLQNVQSAASRGKMMKCELCKLPGATVGCSTRQCPKNYHFMCARKTDCAFQNDKKVFCLRHHSNANIELIYDEEFEVLRMVCVDNDEMRPNRRWQRGVLSSNITVTIGSLTVHQLGRLGVASDMRDCLIPASFRMTRVFWSAFSPTRKTVYTITVSEKKPSFDGNQSKPAADNTNLTISHASEDEHPTPSTPPPSKSKLQSPPHPCVTNLLDRMDSTPPIGPLSPTRRTSHRNERRPTGSYTIISSFNKTLPQILTPLPTTPKYSTPEPRHTTPIKPTKISPDNPFLRPILSEATPKTSPLTLSPKNDPQSEEKEQICSETVISYPNMTLNSGTSGSMLSTTSSQNQLKPDLTESCEKTITTSNSDNEKITPTISEAQNKMDTGTSSVSVQPTTTVHETLPCISVPNIATNAPGENLSPKSLPTTVSSEEKILEVQEELKDVGASVVKNKDAATIIFPTSISPPSKDNNSGADPGMQVSLLRDAKIARDVEDTEHPKTPPPEVSGLWWKKQPPVKNSSSSSKIWKTPRSGSNPEDFDPTFKSDEKYWKLKPGETESKSLSSGGSVGKRKKIIDSYQEEDVKLDSECDGEVKDAPEESGDAKIEDFSKVSVITSQQESLNDGLKNVASVSNISNAVPMKEVSHVKGTVSDETCKLTEENYQEPTTPKLIVRCQKLKMNEKNEICDNDSDHAAEDLEESPKIPAKSMRKFARKSVDEVNQIKPVISSSPQRPMLTRQRSKSQDDAFRINKHFKTKENTSSTENLSDLNSTFINTRSRSRNSSVSIAVLPVSRPESPECNLNTSVANSQTSSAEESEKSLSDNTEHDSVNTPRRYPRRNTYTCLRSFSGLSPNYALASYSRLLSQAQEEKPDVKVTHTETVDGKSKHDLHEPVSAKNEKIPEENANVKVTHTEAVEGKSKHDLHEPMSPKNEKNPEEKETPILTENTPIVTEENTDDEKDNDKPSYEKCITKSPGQLTSHIDEAKQVKMHLSAVGNQITSDDFKVSDNNDYTENLTTETAPANKDSTDEVKMIIDDEELKSSNKISNDPASDLYNEAKTNKEEVESEDQNSPDANISEKSSDEKDDNESNIIEILSALPEVSPLIPNPPLNLDDSTNFGDESIEIQRGGSEDLPPGGNIESPHLKISPEKISENNLSETLKDVEEIPDVTVESLKDDSSFLVTSECPVLNADEVQTLLESPETITTTPTMDYNYIRPVHPQTVCQPTIINYPVYSTGRHAQTTRFPNCPPKPRPPFRRHSQESIQPIYNNRGKVPPAPQAPFQKLVTMTAHPWIRNTPVIVQPSVSPVRIAYPPSQNMTPNFHPLPPNMTYPQQYPAMPGIATTPLSYSLRVTMAMAGSINTETLSPTTIPRFNFANQPQKQQPASYRQQPVNQSYPLQNQYTNLPNPAPHNQNTQDLGEQAAALERLIEFYSAKNNLTGEEKKIVRSIISAQIQNKQLPMPNAHHTQLASNQNKAEEKDAKSSGHKRRRSFEVKQEEKRSKIKKKKKERLNLLSTGLDESLPLYEDDVDDIDTGSTLVDIYNKRDELLKKKKKPFSRLLAPYNIFIGQNHSSNKENRATPPHNTNRPYMVYEITSEDGYSAQGTDLQDLVSQLLSAVQECRATTKGPSPTVALHAVMTPFSFLGVSHDAVRFLAEQLPGARYCHRYRAKYHKHKKTTEEVTHINPHGCARAEQYKGRSKPDMFSFLASKHRYPPAYDPDRQEDDLQQINRRATSCDLPMAMRFRQLRHLTRDSVGVYRSTIHGRGLYCKRDFDSGEMIMEYTGQIIRQELTDKREKYYESKSIGCYMFRMDDFYVVDATVLGSGARFINHSCDPNCYSRIVQFEGKKHIVIFALREIYKGEELTYDYKFPIEDENHKIACTCGARLCRKFMN